VSGKTNSVRITARRRAAAEEIVAVAWELSRAHGLGNFSMRELGDRVGMRAQSVYSYFASKHDIYDAMFAEGNRALIEHMRAPDDGAGADPAARIERGIGRFFEFCTADPVRYQLLFQRTIPDFVPSAESYALARAAYDGMLADLLELGICEDDADLFTGVVAGLVAQQLSNEPGGDRWERLIPRVARMLLRELVVEPSSTTSTHRAPSTP
jgi:AcrR family transcriptional regulator